MKKEDAHFPLYHILSPVHALLLGALPFCLTMSDSLVLNGPTLRLTRTQAHQRHKPGPR
jgi:hypothetical protein